MKLRPDQQLAVNDVRQSFRQHKRVLLRAPTGWGKTVLFCYIAKHAAAKGNRVYILSHRVELVDQISDTLKQWDVPHSYIAAGYDYNPYHMVYVCSIDTLRRRYDKVPAPGLIVVDEAHHAISKTWKAALERWGAPVLGVTATPQRLDGRGLGAVFDHMVHGPETCELISDGRLSDYRAFSVPGFSRDGLHTRAGDFVAAEVADHAKVIVGDVVDHYIKHGQGRKGLVFCPTLAFSRDVAAMYRAHGIACAHLDGETPRDERKRTMQCYREGSIQILTNMGLFSEGLDVGDAVVLQCLRATKSLSMWLQMCGRVLRPAEGKTAIILDHVGNITDSSLGLPDAIREWSLQDIRKRKGDSSDEKSVSVCPSCFAAFFATSRVCPECGEELRRQERKIEQVGGTLAEIDKEKLRREQRRQVGRAQSLDELIELGRQRGYKPGWAHIVWGRRQGRMVRRM